MSQLTWLLLYAYSGGCFRAVSLLRTNAAELRKNQFERSGQRSRNGATTGTNMAAAAKLLSYSSYVDLTFTAKTHTVAPVRELTKEERNFHALDSERVINQTFAILFEAAAALHLAEGNMYIR